MTGLWETADLPVMMSFAKCFFFIFFLFKTIYFVRMIGPVDVVTYMYTRVCVCVLALHAITNSYLKVWMCVISNIVLIPIIVIISLFSFRLVIAACFLEMFQFTCFNHVTFIITKEKLPAPSPLTPFISGSPCANSDEKQDTLFLTFK